MTEIIQLQNLLSQELPRRFERTLALVFTDIVGSTSYFAQFGNEAGRKLQQKHIDLLAGSITKQGGRIVDVAGDGAFAVFPSMDAAAFALCDLQKQISDENMSLSREHHLRVRAGMHWGRVLTDGVQVAGDAVNLCSRIAGVGGPGDIVVSKEGVQEFHHVDHRLNSKALPPATLKGIHQVVECYSLQWLDHRLFPVAVQIEETDKLISLPQQDIISFGRLSQNKGTVANDIVLTLPDARLAQQISRWHFELRRSREGFLLRSLTDQVTDVDGQPVVKGGQWPVRPGSQVRLGGVLTLVFKGQPVPQDDPATESTIYSNR